MIHKDKVLIICPFAKPNLGGVESHIEKLIKYATSKGFFITLFTYKPLTRKVSAASYEKYVTHEIYRVSWFGNGWFPKLEPYFPLTFLYLFPGLFFQSLFFYLKNHKDYKTIHAHGLVSALIVKTLNFFHKKNTIVSTHAVYSFEKRNVLSFLVNWILKDFDHILAVSEVSRLELIKMGLDSTKVFVHPNWIDTDIFNKDKVSNTYFRKYAGTKNVLFVSRLIEKKGVLLLLKTASKMKNTTFHIVGNGPLESEVISASKKYSNIVYHGVLMQDVPEEFVKLLSLYCYCDVFVSPYLYDEGFSTTLIEALSCSTPLIVTDRGSPPTFLSEDVAFYLPKNPTSSDLESYIDTYLSLTLEKKEKLKETCRLFALENFGLKNSDVIVSKY